MGLIDKFFDGRKKDPAPGPPITDFTASDALIDEDQFWLIIQIAKDKANGDYELQQAELANELRKLTPDDIILFENRLRHFRGQANTWELWGAIYIIHGGCGDDSFNDFREWIIGQGRDFYNKSTNDPDTLVDLMTAEIEDVEWEGLGYVPASVFEELTSQDIPSLYQEKFETTGRKWAEEGGDLKQMFPKLAAKYLDNV